MIVSALTLENWMRYQGKHALALGTGTYGIVARYTADARRSNWAGKTAVLEAIRFALFGVHRFDREDDWITHGEDHGSVTVTLSDGVTVERARKRGSPTRLKVTSAGGVSTGAAAQAVLDDHLGLDEDTFARTCWFGQKGFSQFVLDTPAVRLERVEAWLRLGRLRDALDTARDTFRGRLGEEAAAVAALQQQQGATAGVDVDDLRRRLDDAREAARVAEAALDRGLELRRQAAEATAALQRQHDYDALVAQGKSVAQQLRAHEQGLAQLIAAMPPDVEARHEAAVQEAGVAQQNYVRQLRLVNEGFDGECPVTCEACPAKAAVQQTLAERKLTAEHQYLVLRQARAAANALHEQISDRATMQAMIDSDVRLLNALRQQARAMMPQVQAIPSPPADVPDVAALRYTQTEAIRQVERLEGELRQWETAVAQQEQLQAILDQRRRARAEAAVVVEIFRTAMRKIAETALSDIEADANGILQDAGIPLVVSVQWTRTGSGLATHCAECGQSFPTSAKVKHCSACHTPRGAKQVERLDITLSDRSGAAEDLAGAALQLAAWDWVRTDRALGWGVAFLDEPFGALDATNRQSFAAALQAMLRRRFQQAFVVAHHDDVLDALPCRLQVTATEYGSTVQSC